MMTFLCVFGFLTVAVVIPSMCLHIPQSIGEVHSRTRRSCGDVTICMEPFPMLVDLVENDTASALATLTYGVILDNVCSQQENLDTCLDGKPCGDFEKGYTSRAVKEVLAYICGNGRSALLSDSKCFFRDAFQTGVAQCTVILNTDVKITLLSVQIGLAATTEFCGVYKDFLQCVHKEVSNVCSSTSADFMSNVYRLSMKESASQFGCKLNLI